MEFDTMTKAYFEHRIKQVFVYVSNRCQLRCRQCLYKPLLRNDSADIRYDTLINLLAEFHRYGAYKVSFLGGEPTLYYDKNRRCSFADIVAEAKRIGYKYIRMDTNGQFDNHFLDQDNIRLLDEITFSLDGHDEYTNDIVRGDGSFKKCVSNIEYAISKGYRIQITSCVHKYSCHDEKSGIENLNNMIRFAEKLGVYSVNFHPILKVGVVRDSWIEDTDILPETWKSVYDDIIRDILDSRFKVKVRIPMRICCKDDAIALHDKLFYCPVEMGERALIMPDGQIKVCAFTIGTDSCVARYDSQSVRFEKTNNETSRVGTLDKGQLCYNQKIASESFVPLCMSYKPYQSELVWEDIRNE